MLPAVPPRSSAATAAPFTRTALLALLGPGLDRWSATAADGALRLVFLAPPDQLRATVDVAERVRAVDELFVRDVAGVIDEIGTPVVLPVVCRTGGVVKPCDRRLWKGLRSWSDPPSRLPAMLVLGPGGVVGWLGTADRSQGGGHRPPAAHQIPRMRLPVEQTGEQVRQ